MRPWLREQDPGCLSSSCPRGPACQSRRDLGAGLSLGLSPYSAARKGYPGIDALTARCLEDRDCGTGWVTVTAEQKRAERERERAWERREWEPELETGCGPGRHFPDSPIPTAAVLPPAGAWLQRPPPWSAGTSLPGSPGSSQWLWSLEVGEKKISCKCLDPLQAYLLLSWFVSEGDSCWLLLFFSRKI